MRDSLEWVIEQGPSRKANEKRQHSSTYLMEVKEFPILAGRFYGPGQCYSIQTCSSIPGCL